MKKQRLVILSDYGLDDAVALAYIVKHGRLFDGIDVVAVAGNVSYKRSLENARKLISLLHKEKSVCFDGESCDTACPSGQGCVRIRLVGSENVEQAEEDLPDIHGLDGMGGLYGRDVIDGRLEVLRLDAYLDALEDGFILLSLGPLTVTKVLLERFKPSFTLIMAGVVDEKPNFNGLEFNEALDVAAYDDCLKYPHVIATLDSCRAKGFNLAGCELEESCVMNRLLKKSISLAVARHPDNSYVYDFIASLYLTHPHIFKVETVTDGRKNKLNQLKLSDKGFSLAEHIKSIK